MTAGELPVPRADGDREALRILLGARRELTTTRTRQVNRLRALLLGGDDTDRDLSRGTLTDARLQAIARRRARAQIPPSRASGGPRPAGWPPRSALPPPSCPGTNASSPRWSRPSPPRCWTRPASGRSAPPRRSCPGHTAADAATRPRSPRSPAPAPCRPAAAAPPGTASTAAAAGSSTGPCTTSASPGGEPTPAPTLTSPAAAPPARTTPKSAASLKRYIARELFRALEHRPSRLTAHRSVLSATGSELPACFLPAAFDQGAEHRLCPLRRVCGMSGIGCFCPARIGPLDS